MTMLLTGYSFQVIGASSRAELSGVLACIHSCNSLRRDVPAPVWLQLVELGVNFGSAMTINGLIRPDSRFLKEGTGSDGIHVPRPSFICSWAMRSKLKQPLDLGASSSSILDSGLDLAVNGSVAVFSFLSLPLVTSGGLRCSRSLSDFIWSQLATLSCSFCSCSRSALNRSRSRIAWSRSRFAWFRSSLARSLSRIAWSLSRLALSRSL